MNGQNFSGAHDCMCCGEIIYSTDVLCRECRTADCQMTTDASGERDHWECQRPPSVSYENIVFIQGEESNEPLDLLYNSVTPVHYTGATEESIAAAFEYLRQWDYGEQSEECECPSAGIGDRWFSDDGAYILSANLGMSYIGLVRVVVSS